MPCFFSVFGLRHVNWASCALFGMCRKHLYTLDPTVGTLLNPRISGFSYACDFGSSEVIPDWKEGVVDACVKKHIIIRPGIFRVKKSP